MERKTGRSQSFVVWLMLCGVLACGGDPAVHDPWQAEGSSDGGPEGPPVVQDPKDMDPTPAPPPPVEPPPPPAPIFQTGFSMALRHSTDAFGSTQTWRLRVPITRGGERLRFAWRAGDGTMQIKRATVARVDPSLPHGTLATAPVTIRFGGNEGITVDARTRAVSDPVDFAVEPFEEVFVTFEAKGSLSKSAITLLRGSYFGQGSYAYQTRAFGSWDATPVGLVEVAVEGPPGISMVAMGDSITEGYVSGEPDDYRNGWPFIAAKELGQPISNAAVSGQGSYDLLTHLDTEVLTLSGVTDCLVLISTNDIAYGKLSVLTSRLEAIYDKLRPFCRVWGATLPPRERPRSWDEPQEAFETMWQRRIELNDWLRQRSDLHGLLEFGPLLEDPANPHHFLNNDTISYREDGVHPNVRGQRAMGRHAAEVILGKLGLTAPEANP